jgi:glycosyltransferase involved in cell wall biosynthesis
MKFFTAVIVATKGRPEEVSRLLETLTQQTAPPDTIIVSACDPSDIGQSNVDAQKVQVLFGSPGLPAQRNRALTAVRGKCDTIVFFDDDFIPSRYWLEHVNELLASEPDIVCITGNVLIDGVTIGGLEWSKGQSIVDRQDASKKMIVHNYKVRSKFSPYGCNMAFRAKSIEHLTFDERLVRYGWLEDRDFSFRAGPKMIWTDALWGVHLGTTRGRSSGLSFGYSQIVNPWYLAKKGTMLPLDAGQTILRALARNTFGSFFPNRTIDRRGRLKGNLIAAWDIISGRGAPERATDL